MFVPIFVTWLFFTLVVNTIWAGLSEKNDTDPWGNTDVGFDTDARGVIFILSVFWFASLPIMGLISIANKLARLLARRIK